MTRIEFENLMDLAAEIGTDAAWAKHQQDSQAQACEDAADARDAEDFRVRAYGYDDDEYGPGCGQDDSFDYRGRPLLSRFNEAGEPRW